ncbi:MAG TPA: methylated-DNA--[protein]-cysteine S-methyltransferase [Pseudomonadales bacterium]|nr:methylated-DNA--[protein]-cysteine S-methyltransferase [Pseudomonadales bacterium]
MSSPDLLEKQQDYQRIEKAIHYLQQHRLTQPSLTDLSAHLHMSESHLQRVFTRWAGVSPKRFLQYLTKQHAKKLLRSHSVVDTAFSVGLSGSSRLHDLMLSYECVTPGEYQQQGKHMLIEWGIHPSPFGQCFLAANQRGICFMAFYDSTEELAEIQSDFQSEWALAQIQRNDELAAHWLSEIFPSAANNNAALHLVLKGSPFQLKVWEALIRIPCGQLTSYSDIAVAVDQPKAGRAVGSAIARNQIAYLIPCHRVIRSSGEFNHYRWGIARKQAILAWESAHCESQAI